MDVGDRRLGGRDEIQFAQRARVQPFLHRVILVGELRELAHAFQALRPDHERRRHLRVAVLARVQVEHELDQRPLQLRAPIRVKHEPAARELGRPREIHQPQLLAQLHVRLRLERERRLLARARGPPGYPPRFCRPAPTRAAGSAAAASIGCGRPPLPPPACRAPRSGRPGRRFPSSWPRPPRVFFWPMSAPISLDTRLRWALSASTSASSLRRCSSHLSTSSMRASSPAPRVARRWRTKSGRSRISLISSIGAL